MGGLEKGQKDAYIILMVSNASPEPYIQHNNLLSIKAYLFDKNKEESDWELERVNST